MSDKYEESLERDGRDLTRAASMGQLRLPIFREAEVGATLDQLDRGRSVVLMGAAGVGKTAILHGVVLAMLRRNRGRVIELSTTQALSGTVYLGEWQTKATTMARQARDQGITLYIPDAWNLPRAGRTNNNDSNLLDALRPFVEAGQLQLVIELTPAQLNVLERTPRFVDLFQIVRVQGLEPEQVDATIARAASQLRVVLDARGRRALVELTSRFLRARPQPGPAIDLLDQVARMWHEQGGDSDQPIQPAFIEQAFAQRTGLPLFVVSQGATRRASEIRAWFLERIVGQPDAIEAVVEVIALFKAGLHDPSRPIGAMLFVGPTGVGKTELARAVATFLFGSPDRLLRFDLSEFKDFHSFEVLTGSSRDPNRPAALVDAVRTQPFQVVLLDELEKAHPNVFDLLMPLLDAGRLAAPGTDGVDFRNTIIIATSNAGAYDGLREVGFGSTGANLSERDRAIRALEGHFRPEFLNRFQHIVVFHHLSREQVRSVARQELRRVLLREGITTRNLLVEVEDSALELVIEQGYDTRYGARALKRTIRRQLVLPIAMTIMEKKVEQGQMLKVTARDGQVRVQPVDTNTSREARAARAPVTIPGDSRATAQRVDRDELAVEVARLQGDVNAIAKAVDEAGLRDLRQRLLERRQSTDFWQVPEDAARALRDLARVTVNLERLERLRSRAEALAEDLRGADTRPRLKRLAEGVAQGRVAMAQAWRELVYMGPEGYWDALVEVKPIGPTGARARDLIVRVYLEWARGHRIEALWLREPVDTVMGTTRSGKDPVRTLLDDDEPAFFALKGRYVCGLLAREGGLHRVRESDEPYSVCRVRVAPWTDVKAVPEVRSQKALKAPGAHGGTLKSRLELSDGLVLQNERTLVENQALAGEICGAWAAAPAPSDEVVRRYDLATPMLRDHMTGIDSGRRDALSSERFHELLQARVDHLAPVAHFVEVEDDTTVQ